MSTFWHFRRAGDEASRIAAKDHSNKQKGTFWPGPAHVVGMAIAAEDGHRYDNGGEHESANDQDFQGQPVPGREPIGSGQKQASFRQMDAPVPDTTTARLKFVVQPRLGHPGRPPLILTL
jgi:hypothetical protein